VISEFRNLSWSAVYVAYQNGYFQKAGIAPEFALYKDGPIAFQGMHGGDSQFCLLSQEPVLKAEEEGLDSSIIYSVLDTRLYGFVSASDIKSVKDLKGQAIFAGMPGSAPYSFVSAILKEGGLDPQKDVTFVNLDYSASMSALSKGQIKASYINVDNRVEIQSMDVNVLVDTSNPADAAKYLKTDVFTGEIIATTGKFATENPKTVQGFVNAVHKGTKWINEHNAAEVAKLISPLFQGMNVDVLAKKIAILKGAVTKTGYISEDSQTAVENFCIKNGVIKAPIPYNQIIDMQFVKAIK
jgi:NitT/TauT family transport system substrate-binding protein